MKESEYARRVFAIRQKLLKTAMSYFQNETTAKDVLDEAIYRGLLGAKKLRHDAYFDTWMTRILLNVCHREYKRVCRETDLPAFDLTADNSASFDALPLKDAIAHLPADYKDIIVLRYFAGYTQKETADILAIPQGTVATRQKKALSLLRISLSEEEGAS